MNAAALLAGIRDANYHNGGIRCLRLLRLDEAFLSTLRTDVERLCHTERGSKVSDPGHVTNWTRPIGEIVQFSLLNASGRYDDFTTDHDLSCFGKRFHDSKAYPALAGIMDVFPHTVNFRINLMGPDARLSAHEEHSVIRTRRGSVALRTRFHLPIITNPRA